jgi:hypothetical protein
MDRLADIQANIEAGMQVCLQIARRTPYPGENLASIGSCVKAQKERLAELKRLLAQKAAANAGERGDAGGACRRTPDGRKPSPKVATAG